MITNEVLNITLLILLIITGAYILAKFMKYMLGLYIIKHTEKLDTDSTNYNFLQHAIIFIIIIAATISIIYTIPALREIGITLLASAGLFAAIIGLAAQQAFANIVSGVFIVIFKPFRVGDLIEITTQRGVVEDITLRHTIIRTIENRRLIIPNSVVSKESIINSNIMDSKICNLLEVGISYESDINKAIWIIQDLAIKHESCVDNRSESQIEKNEPTVQVRVLGFGESSINLRAYIWSKNSAKGFFMKCDLYKSIKEEFDKNDIEIPYPHRTIVYKNKENNV